MNIKEIYEKYSIHFKVETDTRKNLKNSIYFALKGENFNGNKFAEDALKKGANYAIVDEEEYLTDDRIILVDNVLETLQELAKYHRIQLGIKIISLTGSNGKTTTKELINAVMSRRYNCVATKGNLNNHIGVPLTLLSMKPNTEFGIVEMGANHPGEIDLLCKIALPDYGYITNFGKVHLEGFGDLNGVIKAKTELYRHLKRNNKTAFINSTDPVQVKNSTDLNTITFGDEKSVFPVQFIDADPFVSLQFENNKINSQLIGVYNYHNIATAVAIGKYFKVSDQEIKNAIENYIPGNNRSQIIEKGSNKIILDAYNANPTSMKVALENLSQLKAKNKIAILGDMFEIGKEELLEHSTIVDQAQNTNIDTLILIGETFSKVKTDSNKTKQYKSFEDFKDNFDSSEIKNCTVLIKASRGMALERVLEIIS
ncbi:MAG: UDP-N-acetylmuramoyl-tripeptide--D-alanyl-D-alanine ligase [Bacteroidota bacterium]